MMPKFLLMAMTLAALPQPVATPGEGAISLSITGQRNNMVIRIDPDGRATIDTDEVDMADPSGIKRIRHHDDRYFGFIGYRRIAALVSPVRRWAGDTVPCHHPLARPGPLSPPIVDVMMTVTWEAEKKRVTVPITCQFGPVQNEIELVRAALDQVQTWQRESPYPWDPAANVIEESIVLGND